MRDADSPRRGRPLLCWVWGGMMMRILGYTRRYCYRECVQRRLVRGNGPHSRLSGRDLLGIYTLLENRLEEKAEAESGDSP